MLLMCLWNYKTLYFNIGQIKIEYRCIQRGFNLRTLIHTMSYTAAPLNKCMSILLQLLLANCNTAYIIISAIVKLWLLSHINWLIQMSFMYLHCKIIAQNSHMVVIALLYLTESYQYLYLDYVLLHNYTRKIYYYLQ